MPVLYRTSLPPASFRAPLCSMAYFLHLICVICQYFLPFLLCVYYVIQLSQYTTNTEKPAFVPTKIRKVILFYSDNSYLELPSAATNKFPSFWCSPSTDYLGNVLGGDLQVSIKHNYTEKVQGVKVLFDYEIMFNKWASATITGTSSFVASLPHPFTSVSCEGDLEFDQLEPFVFRGVYSSSNALTYNEWDYSQNLINQENNSAIGYIKWYDPIPSFFITAYLAGGSTETYTFDVKLHINTPEIPIIHTLPLISIFENLFIMFLSTHILARIIFTTIQHYCFRYGFVKTWIEKHYISP